MAGRGYSWFHGLNTGKLSADRKEPFFDYCGELEDKGYPYEIVQVRYTIGGDNGPPDSELPDAVRRWNEEIESPKLVIATAQEMFEEFEKRYGAVLPVVSGDFTPYWEDGAASTARETALNRAAAARLTQAETSRASAPNSRQKTHRTTKPAARRSSSALASPPRTPISPNAIW